MSSFCFIVRHTCSCSRHTALTLMGSLHHHHHFITTHHKPLTTSRSSTTSTDGCTLSPLTTNMASGDLNGTSVMRSRSDGLTKYRTAGTLVRLAVGVGVLLIVLGHLLTVAVCRYRDRQSYALHRRRPNRECTTQSKQGRHDEWWLDGASTALIDLDE